ncbi:MAG: DUF2271 domain-containing protein [Bacteroidota bacterium]
MKPLSKFILGCLLFLVTGAAIKATKTNKIYISNFENVLGTSLEIKVQAATQSDADLAENAAMNEIDRLSSILSAYDQKSEFSAFLLSSGSAEKLSPELFEVLSLFDQWKSRTNGALDPSAELISKIWKTASLKQQLPLKTELEQAVAVIKNKHYRLDQSTGTAVHLDNAPLILNSFAKSYIISKAAEAASRVANVNGVIVNIGGDIVVRGELSEPVEIVDPMASADNDAPLTRLKISNMAVATSGNYRRGFEIDNKWYSHIVDPRNGKPVGHIISATVVAPNASDAGALATAFNVMRPEESLKLLTQLPGTEALLITSEGKRIESKGWKQLEMPVERGEESITFASYNADKTWNTKYELAIDIEIAKIEGARIHSPFVAVWVEDENKNTVRNLAVWYSKPEWLHDLRSWHRGNGTTYAADGTKMSSIGSATRSAGKYTLKWDGKDDSGALVKAEKYTVYIEAAREHGTHQLMSSEMNFNGSSQIINLTGNVEIAAASLDYRKRRKD